VLSAFAKEVAIGRTHKGVNDVRPLTQPAHPKATRGVTPRAGARSPDVGSTLIGRCSLRVTPSSWAVQCAGIWPHGWPPAPSPRHRSGIIAALGTRNLAGVALLAASVIIGVRWGSIAPTSRMPPHGHGSLSVSPRKVRTPAEDARIPAL